MLSGDNALERCLSEANEQSSMSIQGTTIVKLTLNWWAIGTTHGDVD